jgi:OOP family OmpA-OmpF porin
MKRLPKSILTKFVLKYTLIASVLAAGAAQAQTDYLSAGGQPVKSAGGECWRTASWTPDVASLECDPLIASRPLPVAQAPVPEAPRLEGPATQRVTFATEVLFDFDGAELRPDGRKVLDDLAQKLLASKLDSVAAVAHADRVGEAEYNERLSARRAAAIHAYLMEKGVPGTLMRVEARGEREPLTAERCHAMGPESRQNLELIACLQPDRRVEIEVAGQRSR